MSEGPRPASRGSRSTAFACIVCAYVTALLAAVLTGAACARAATSGSLLEHPVAIAACADLVATLVVFAFSYGFRNSSFYDAYWSVAPPFILLYWALRPEAASADSLRRALMIGGLTIWAVRLTFNWARGWQGLHHEDWRYLDKQREFPRTYWLVSLGGIHLFPTVVVFLGCLPGWVALTHAGRPFGALDVLATLVVAGAIALETVADRQLHRFVTGPRRPGETLSSGLWSVCRHPNYLGEILFWWGIFLYALAADPGAWWSAAGAAAIHGMFLTISLPMMETRALARRSDYDRIVRRIPRLLPWPRPQPAQSGDHR